MTIRATEDHRDANGFGLVVIEGHEFKKLYIEFGDGQHSFTIYGGHAPYMPTETIRVKVQAAERVSPAPRSQYTLTGTQTMTAKSLYLNREAWRLAGSNGYYANKLVSYRQHETMEEWFAPVREWIIANLPREVARPDAQLMYRHEQAKAAAENARVKWQTAEAALLSTYDEVVVELERVEKKNAELAAANPTPTP